MTSSLQGYMKTMGVTANMYWLSHYITDYLKMAVFSLCTALCWQYVRIPTNMGGARCPLVERLVDQSTCRRAP